MGLARVIARRLALLVPVLLAMSFIVFIMVRLIPGDPVTAYLGEEYDPQTAAALRQQLGLDKPVHEQYIVWLSRVIQGDLGRSIQTSDSVSRLILQRLPATIELSLFAMLVSLAIGLPAGILSATRRYSKIDRASMVGSMLGISVPNFWLGILLIIVFAVQLRLLPPAFYTPIWENPADNLRRMVLPSITLGVQLSAITARQMRSSMLEVIRQDYIRTARAKGLVEHLVIYRHALKNALIPVVTIVGLQIGALMGGAVITETLFSLPGVGRLLRDGIFARDYPVVQGTVLFISFAFVLTNLVVDIVYTFLDPRIRYEGPRRA